MTVMTSTAAAVALKTALAIVIIVATMSSSVVQLGSALLLLQGRLVSINECLWNQLGSGALELADFLEKIK